MSFWFDEDRMSEEAINWMNEVLMDQEKTISPEDMDLLKRTPGSEWILQNLHQKLPGLRDLVQRIGFALKHELDLEQVRLRTVVTGKSTEDLSSIIKDKSFLKRSHSYKNNEAKKQFSKIRKLISGN